MRQGAAVARAGAPPRIRSSIRSYRGVELDGSLDGVGNDAVMLGRIEEFAGSLLVPRSNLEFYAELNRRERRPGRRPIEHPCPGATPVAHLERLPSSVRIERRLETQQDRSNEQLLRAPDFVRSTKLRRSACWNRWPWIRTEKSVCQRNGIVMWKRCIGGHATHAARFMPRRWGTPSFCRLRDAGSVIWRISHRRALRALPAPLRSG